ncbi:MAG: hypothetical protein HKN11_02090 [Rhizobiales bacterium]|nr:hypothetical protein [Hyphomicrobiales bacterium]
MRIGSLFAGLLLSATLPLTASVATAEGFAGLLTGKKRLAPITLASGQPMTTAPYELQSGKYYSLDIVSDGSAELAVEGADFFRNVWINEVVINDIEIRPLGLSSLEFDDDGKATITFVTIRPGTFKLRIPGTKSDSQSAVFVVK